MTPGSPLEAARLTLDDFRSADAPMMRCLRMARAACRTDLPILILGETGTGKTLLARAIHNSSRRSAAPFISFNAAALSETLVDSQLFGHEKGAYTGAQRDLRGKFELADGGTLFIDEIADMNPVAQAKILRAVEYGEFERLGSERIAHADVRIVSATHYPLDRHTGLDGFRRDLFYRISGLTLVIPPLRERPGDLRALLASSILRAASQQGRSIDGLSKRAAELLFEYSWPGNLRELDRAIHAAVALTEGQIIEEDSVLLQTHGIARPPVAPAEPRRKAHLSLAAVERDHISQVLEQLGGNKTRAAKALGIARSTLERKLADSK